MDEKQFLYDLLTETGVSGQEERVQEKVAAHLKGYAHNVWTDEIGDVVGVLNQDSPVKILLAAHADEIGLVVTDISEDGFLWVTKTGGIYTRTYPGQKVRVMTRSGIIYASVVHSGAMDEKKEVKATELVLDIGASSGEEAGKWVRPGDYGVFDTDYRPLLGNRLSARALDDRVGIFCITQAMKRAAERGCRTGVYAASTVGEETSKNGAFWVSRRVKPTAAIVVDVTGTSDYEGTGSREGGNIRLGGGPALLRHPLSHKKLTTLLMEIAEEEKIPVQFEVGAGRTCTDADQIHFSNDGVPTAVVSVPLRYMHTPGEVCDMGDVDHVIELLAELCVKSGGFYGHGQV